MKVDTYEVGNHSRRAEVIKDVDRRSEIGIAGEEERQAGSSGRRKEMALT